MISCQVHQWYILYGCIVFHIWEVLVVVVVVVATENIPEVILKNGAKLTVLGRMKIRIRTDYLEPTVRGTDHVIPTF